ncbi:MAG: T9SS type A sorting domain-containing protein, partial [Candidatus Marinimicrobia bacterium]|nr:T9SS type A sorting domain-containing protein [Candidatus Neomarinimicrobiota bacterium]
AYPNPFNPSTTIQFSMVEASDFEMSVYNIAGQKLDVLSSGYAEPGVYKQVWNAADFTSGVYFIRLVAGANIATQKVVLIK